MHTTAINALTELHRNTTDRPVRTLETIAKSLTDCQGCEDWDELDGICGRYSREEWAETLVILGRNCDLWLFQ